MSEEIPYFSILIPSYNRPEYLAAAVHSVLASTFADFELIVSDDRSPRQAEIIAALASVASDARCTLVAQPENLGEARNRHFLMQRAQGRYRIIMGDDDKLPPDALARLHATICARPGYDLYLFGYSIIDESGRVFETRRALAPVEISRDRVGVTRDLLCSDLYPFWLYHPATFCFPATLHREIVPNHGIGIGDDLIFLFDAILAGKRALIIPEVLFQYRKFMGPQAYSQTNLSRARLANVITRRHIFYHLLGRDSLPAAFADFIRSREFRERFVYNAIVTDADATLATIASLELRPEHRVEAETYWRRHRGGWFRLWLQLRRLADYARYFGAAGLVEAARVCWQRRRYRQSIAGLATVPTHGH